MIDKSMIKSEDKWEGKSTSETIKWGTTNAGK